MDLYNISEDYIDYLRSYDNKVPENKGSKRPYVGIVLSINNCDYYVPLTSPKPKHQKMSNGVDFRRINGGVYGAINFNNMIPVDSSALVKIDVNNHPDIKYRRLLQNQLLYIKADKKNIIRTAQNLYNIVVQDDSTLSSRNKTIKQRCCNFAVLEIACSNYNSL